MTFSVTHLGHQGWLCASETTRVLVDPLLTDEYSPGYRAIVWPARAIDLRAMPAIDAIVLSHEHSDHVNIGSLAQLDRAIPIVMPERSAGAIRGALEKLGFGVAGARAGDRFAIGDLVLQTLAGEHRDHEFEGEWANLLLSIAGADGSFFTYVDGWPTPATIEAIGRVSVFCHANNAMDWSCLEGGRVIEAARATTETFARDLIDVERGWWPSRELAPIVTAIAGPGLAFVGDDAWLDQVLAVDSDEVAAAMQRAFPERAIRSPSPGETYTFRGHALVSIDRAPFVTPIDHPRAKIDPPRALIEDVARVASDPDMTDDDWQLALDELDRLARYLYGRTLFRTLHALDAHDLGGRRADLAFVLRADDGAAYVCEYVTHESRFALVDCDDPLATYVCGVECWGCDLRDVARGAILPQRLLGHLRTWSFSPLPLSPLDAVWRFFDFVHRPEAGAAFYDALIARTATPPVVDAGSAGVRRAPRRH